MSREVDVLRSYQMNPLSVTSRQKNIRLFSTCVPACAILYRVTGSFKELNCEQSLFSSKIRGKERKTRLRANMTVSVTCEWRCREPLVANTAAKRLRMRHLRPFPVYTCCSFFVSFPQKRNGIVFSSGVNYLHSGGNIQSE